jgi:hypothetical protein
MEDQFNKQPKKEELDINKLGPEILALWKELDVLTASLSTEDREAMIEPIKEKCKAILASGKSNEDAMAEVKGIIEEVYNTLILELSSSIRSLFEQLNYSTETLSLTLKERKEFFDEIVKRIKWHPSKPFTAAEALESLKFLLEHLKFLDGTEENDKIQ